MSRSGAHRRHGTDPVADHPVVVRVVPRQNLTSVQQAVAPAIVMGVGRVCVWVDASSTFVGEESGGTIMRTPLDLDQDDDGHRLRVEPDMHRRLTQHLEGSTSRGRSSTRWASRRGRDPAAGRRRALLRARVGPARRGSGRRRRRDCRGRCEVESGRRRASPGPLARSGTCPARGRMASDVAARDTPQG